MNLVEGERIEQIERTEDGWWSGVGPGGYSRVSTADPPCVIGS